MEREQLKKIIIEEIQKAIQERCHNSETGFWEKCRPGSVYSQTKGSKRYDSKYDGRGVYRGKKEDGTPRLSAKYGSNQSKKTSAGRVVYNTGEPIKNPKYSVSKYKQEYLEEIQTALQAWLASQDGNKDEQGINEDNACAAERREAYQQGLNAALNFIQHYETSKKGKDS
tara:strand:- start:626 stop:1135 length:510 start_codon:yes stop_codon:yes gene_type:complete